jgi:hypothetical protein
MAAINKKDGGGGGTSPHSPHTPHSPQGAVLTISTPGSANRPRLYSRALSANTNNAFNEAQEVTSSFRGCSSPCWRRSR